jgi:Domain of unknown function (DUF1707)
MDTTSGPSRPYAAGDLRVSDADRDRALAELSEHFQAGRLTSAEMEDRTGRALSARTGNDLAVLLADLPPASAGAAAVAARDSGRRIEPVLWICAALAVVAVVAVAVVTAPGHHTHIVLVPWWLILVAVFVLRRRRRHRDGDETGQVPAAGPGDRDERP